MNSSQFFTVSRPERLVGWMILGRDDVKKSHLLLYFPTDMLNNLISWLSLAILGYLGYATRKGLSRASFSRHLLV